MSMTLIEHIEVGSGGAASISFVSVGDIPSDYTDLMLKISARSTSEINSTIKWAEIILKPNNSSSGLSARSLLGYSTSSVASNTDAITGGFANGNTTTANTFSSVEIYIPNYRSSVAKSWSIDSVTEHNGVECLRWISANLWTGTDPITSIVLGLNQGDFAQYSSATLFGVTSGADGTTTVS